VYFSIQEVRAGASQEPLLEKTGDEILLLKIGFLDSFFFHLIV
jgi:hypothetical protein